MNSTNNRYLLSVKITKELRVYTDVISFGVTSSFLIILLSLYQIYFAVNSSSFFYYFRLIGYVLFILTIFNTLIIEKFFCLFKDITSSLMTFVLQLFLTVVFLSIVFPVNLVLRLCCKKHDFQRWNSDFNIGLRSYWHDVPKGSHFETFHGSSGGFFANLLRVIGYFAKLDKIYMFPVIIVFIVLSLFFIFLQSSSVAPLIYTLF